jgi:hypothetical protein
MKIVEEIYDHDVAASNQIAKVFNELSAAFWSNHAFLNLDKDDYRVRDHYTQINREFYDILNKNIDVLFCELVVDDRMLRNTENIEPYIKQRIAAMLAEELVKNNSMYIRAIDNMRGQKRYSVSIPFIKTIRKPTTERQE